MVCQGYENCFLLYRAAQSFCGLSSIALKFSPGEQVRRKRIKLAYSLLSNPRKVYLWWTPIKFLSRYPITARRCRKHCRFTRLLSNNCGHFERLNSSFGLRNQNCRNFLMNYSYKLKSAIHSVIWESFAKWFFEKEQNISSDKIVRIQ